MTSSVEAEKLMSDRRMVSSDLEQGQRKQGEMLAKDKYQMTSSVEAEKLMSDSRMISSRMQGQRRLGEMLVKGKKNRIYPRRTGARELVRVTTTKTKMLSWS